jgi:N-methylhydantoinase A
VFDGRGGGRSEVPLYARADFTPGAALPGPAIIVEAGTSTFVSEAFDVMLDGGGALVLERRS